MQSFHKVNKNALRILKYSSDLSESRNKEIKQLKESWMNSDTKTDSFL